MTLACIFPGQGSQSVGMLSDLAATTGIVTETFAEASTALGYDSWALTQNGPADRLNQTEVTQPAMLAAGVAVWRAWEQRGGARPKWLAGHSLGEYTALVCAGAMTLGDAAGLVEERGRFMQEAVPEGQGAMAAILGLDDQQVIDVCAQAAQGDIVAAVNFNAPGQVVIAGSAAAVERASDLARAAGAKRALRLPVSVPSHCALMQPAAERLMERLRSVKVAAPAIPVLHNVDVSSQSDPDAIRDRLARQLYSPVRWVETIQAMAAQGVDSLIECGPGKVLAGLGRRIDKDLQHLAVYDGESLSAALA